jgi:hypothetical protein
VTTVFAQNGTEMHAILGALHAIHCDFACLDRIVLKLYETIQECDDVLNRASHGRPPP